MYCQQQAELSRQFKQESHANMVAPPPPQQQQAQVQDQGQTAFLELVALEKITKERRQTEGLRKRMLQTEVGNTMKRVAKTTYTEDGKNYAISTTEKVKAKADKKFRKLAYNHFQESLGRVLEEDEFEKWEAFIQEKRIEGSQKEQERIKITPNRPPELLF